MNREQRLQLIKLMVESLELPEYGEKSYRRYNGEMHTYEGRLTDVTECEFKRKCVQIRKEIMHLINSKE